MKAKKLQYIYLVVEERRKQREEEGRKADDGPQPEFSQDPTDEELENIEIPDDLTSLEEHEYYRIRLERASEKIEKERGRRLTNRDDEETAFNKYVRAKEIYRGKVEQIKEIETTSLQMKEDLRLRKRRWEEFKNHICEFAATKFDETRKSKSWM
jgi:hypothetical protein